MSQQKKTRADSRLAKPSDDNRPFQTWALNSVLHLALIVVAGALVYANSFGVPFTFDDNHSIVDNPVIKNLSEFWGGAGYAHNPRRFLGILTIALNYHFGGLNVTGYHLVNLLVHLGNGLLVYALGRLTFRTPFFHSKQGERHVAPTAQLVPLFAALLFVVHPIQTQAVTYVVQRLASLATFFYLAAVLCYGKARIAMGDGESSRGVGRVAAWFLLCLLATLCAMRTKEISATIPVAILFYEFSFFGANPKKRSLLLLPVLLMLLVIPAGMLLAGKPAGALLADVSALTRETQDISRGSYLLTQFCVIATYLRLLILPVAQNLDYDYPVYHSLFAPRVLSSLLLILALLALAFVLYRKSGKDRCGSEVSATGLPAFGNPGETRQLYRLIAFGTGWFFLALTVESSVIPIRDVIFEHRVYLPSFGAFLAFSAAAALLARRGAWPAAAAAGAVIIVALGGAAHARNAVWGDQLTLWQDVLEKSPGKARPYNNFGLLLKERGDIDGAIRCFQRAVALQPDATAYDNLGVALHLRGLSREALGCLEQARKLDPNYYPVYTNIGKIYLDTDDPQNAIAQFQKALAISPQAPIALNNIASAYLKLQQYDHAIKYLKEGQRVNPDDLMIGYNLAAAFYLKGGTDVALRELNRVLMADPGHQAANELMRIITGR